MSKKIEEELVKYKNELEKVRVLYYKLLGAVESTTMLLEFDVDETKKKTKDKK